MRRVFLALMLLPFAGCAVRGVVIAPSCRPTQRLAIVAQSVPSATRVPCVELLLPGWSPGGVHVEAGRTAFTLNSDRAGERALHVTFTATCETDGMRSVPTSESGVSQFESSTRGKQRTRFEVREVFTGGCVATSLEVPTTLGTVLFREARSMVELLPRSELRAQLQDRVGVDLGERLGRRQRGPEGSDS